jgi:hypothetical protein
MSEKINRGGVQIGEMIGRSPAHRRAGDGEGNWPRLAVASVQNWRWDGARRLGGIRLERGSAPGEEIGAQVGDGIP